MTEHIRLTMPPTGKGTAAILAHLPVPGLTRPQPVRVGTSKAISAGHWEADLDRSAPESGPQGPEEGRGPMAYGKHALLQQLQEWADEHGPWWPATSDNAAEGAAGEGE